MAKIPDGWVAITHSDRKGIKIDIETKELVMCRSCKNWIPGYITDSDDFIPPKCGKYQQMVGHSSDDYCSLTEKDMT